MSSIKKDYNDFLIVPSIDSDINSRKQIFPYYKHQSGFHLPLITAPMDTVVDKNNDHLFAKNNINICYPRGEKPSRLFDNGVLQFESISLTDFEDIIKTEKITPNSFDGKYYVCIDIANGHMKFLHDLSEKSKKIFGDKIVLMVGNIANPETYKIMCNIGVDFVRVGIGNGNGCLTTQQTGVGYPAASLIKECYQISIDFTNPTKIIADGGINTYSDVLKAISLGANYVMMGSVFNRALESCGDTYFMDFKINPYGNFASWLFDNKFKLTKKFRGMSTKEVQKKWGKEQLTTSEGVTRVRKVDYKLNKWVENFTDYLRSNMSYCNSHNLSEYVGTPDIVEISEKAYLRFNK